MLFYYIFTVCYVITLIDVDFYMSAQRNFDTKDILFLLSKEALSTGNVAKQIRCSRITALKYLRELKDEKRVIETRISSTSNVWQLNFDNQILIGDCAETLKGVETESVDLIVTDPPYGYNFMGLNWDKALPSLESLTECCRVLKHGAFGFFMCAPRQDCLSEMIVRLRNVGFNINFSSIYWVYMTGLPHGANISKLVDKRAGVEREVIGVRTKLQSYGHENSDWQDNCYGKDTDRGGVQLITAPATPEAKELAGSYAGCSLKPATEIIIVAMRPLSEPTYVEQALINKKGITWLVDCK